MNKLPNFFIIGAPKCGTTSLAAWLAEHPNIYMSPIKEPFYFSRDINYGLIRDWHTYQKLFEHAEEKHRAIGEASTFYLFSEVAVPAIEEKIGNAKYIVMLRNPIDMAYALHEQHLRSFNENVVDFRQAWKLAKERQMGRNVPPKCKAPILLDYPSWCLLGTQMERLYAVVPQERVLPLVLDDMKRNPRREYLRVLEFLDVPDDGRREFPVHNAARKWRSYWIGKGTRALALGVGWSKYVRGLLPRRSLGLVRLLERMNSRHEPRQPLPRDLYHELKAFFANDVHKLEKLLGREFPEWRSANDKVP